MSPASVIMGKLSANTNHRDYSAIGFNYMISLSDRNRMSVNCPWGWQKTLCY